MTELIAAIIVGFAPVWIAIPHSMCRFRGLREHGESNHIAGSKL